MPFLFWHENKCLHHEAYVLSNEVGGKNLYGATIKCAICGLCSIIPCNCSWSVSLSLKCYVWFGSRHHDFLTIKDYVMMRLSFLGYKFQKNKSFHSRFGEWWGTNLLVDATVDPYYGSSFAKIRNCIHGCLYCCEITTPFSVNTKIGSGVGAWRGDAWWKTITNGTGISTMMVFLVMMVYEVISKR